MKKYYDYEYFLNNKFQNWDPDKFNWENDSWTLAFYCCEYFDIWWDPNKFNWSKSSKYLIVYCGNHFDKWYNKRKFMSGIKYILLLHNCFDNINKWWNLKNCVKYFSDKDIKHLIERNNKYNLLDKSEIIKLKLLRS